MQFYVYLLECSDKSFYCGYSSNLERRLEEHNEGRGSKYTRARRPVRLIYSEKQETRSSAMKREAEIKKFSRKEKEALAIK